MSNHNGNNNSCKVLLVDDDPVLLQVHAAYLQDMGYSPVTAVDGSAALQQIMHNPKEIDVIVSDVVMPEMDGYALCEALNQNGETRDIPFIFVSGLSNLEEKLKGYSVGGTDYITKPVQKEELFEKIKALVQRRSACKELNQKFSDSQNVALQAMTFSSELGQVIEFYRNILNAANYEEVARILFNLTDVFNLDCSIQMYAPNKILNLSSRDVVSPLEANVIELARQKDRFYHFGSKTVVNYRTFSILVKNMPVDDVEKYGRYNDLLGMICNGLEAKIQQLNDDILVQKKEEMIKSIQAALNNIEQAFGQVQKENILAIEDMTDELNEAVMILGLTEHQEENIGKITERCLNRTNNAFYQGIGIRENLEQIQKQFALALDIHQISKA